MITQLALSLVLAFEPALVELFSSEGCSSCPPAEALLRAEGAADPTLLTLEFHVDYWDSLGWRDPFSAASFSDRQSRYASWRHTGQVYTPQAVVDGSDAFVGSDSIALHAALKHARSAGKRMLVLQLEGNMVTISSGDTPAGDLWVAVTESGLASKVERGENQGRTLRHGPVVRRFEALGALPAGRLQRSATLRLDPSWQRANLTVVAAVQEPRSGRVVALGSIAVPSGTGETR
jgi:hypothetical protein